MRKHSLLLFVCLLTTCKNKETAKPDTQGPQIEIRKPLSGQHFSDADTIHLEALIQDNDGLHEHIVKLVTLTDSPLFANEDHGHEQSLLLTMDIPVHTTKSMATKLIVKANDHSGNVSEQSINLILQP